MASMSDEPNVVIESVGAVDWIRLNRPEVRNAITRESAEQVTAALEASATRGARVTSSARPPWTGRKTWIRARTVGST